MKNFKYSVVVISVLTILYSCKKDDSNPLNAVPIYTPTYSINIFDSTLAKNLTVELFYPDSIWFYCELLDSNYAYIELTIRIVTGWLTWDEQTLIRDYKKAIDFSFTVNTEAAQVNIFETYYTLTYWKTTAYPKILARISTHLSH